MDVRSSVLAAFDPGAPAAAPPPPPPPPPQPQPQPELQAHVQAQAQPRQNVERSNSSPVSTPPKSTPSPIPAPALISNTTSTTQTPHSFGSSSQSTIRNNPQTSQKIKLLNPDAVKKPRKPKLKDAIINAPHDPNKPAKEKKPRKPREPRDPTQPPRKRQKLNPQANNAQADAQADVVIAQGFTAALQTIDPLRVSAPALASPLKSAPSTVQAKPQKRATDTAPKFILSAQASPRSAASGQHYDPIRSAVSEYNADPARSTTPINGNATPLALPKPSPRPPSSILSLIDPPGSPARTPGLRPLVSALQNSSRAAPQRPSSPPLPLSVSVTKPILHTKSTPVTKSSPTTKSTSDTKFIPSPPASTGASAAASVVTTQPAASVVSANENRQDSTSTPSPTKAVNTKDMPGAGLLPSSTSGAKKERVPRVYAALENDCIVIDVPIIPGGNNYVNFMKEVEQKYGFDVAHPRVAEHRKRMRQIAAAGAALESGTGTGTGSGSADDMALDSDGDNSGGGEGDVAENGTTGDRSGVPSTPAKKKRQLKSNMYDKNDDFIDDTELLWEEQALASRDGYFVWSGPLVTPGDTPTVENADGSMRRGRGGRARGGAARGEGAAAKGKPKAEGRIKRGGGGGGGVSQGGQGGPGGEKRARAGKAGGAKAAATGTAGTAGKVATAAAVAANGVVAPAA